MNNNYVAQINFIDENKEILYKIFASHVPRIDDEVRFDGGIIYKVIHVVWIYDEIGNPFDRVNIGIYKTI